MIKRVGYLRDEEMMLIVAKASVNGRAVKFINKLLLVVEIDCGLVRF